MILEGLVTTRNADGSVHVTPMGPLFDEEDWPEPKRFLLKPFKTSLTFANLERNPYGVFHITDDPLLLARATIGQATAPTVPAESVPVERLVDCCRFHEFRIDRAETSRERAELVAVVTRTGRVRDFLGLNRALLAVVEGAIHASRIALFPRAELLLRMSELRPLVEKTGRSNAREAFDLLENYIRERGRDAADGSVPDLSARAARSSS